MHQEWLAFRFPRTRHSTRIPYLVLTFLVQCLVNSALHPPGVAKSSTSIAGGEGGNVTSAGWGRQHCVIPYGM